MECETRPKYLDLNKLQNHGNTMVLVRNEEIKRSLGSKKWLFFTTFVGLGLLIAVLLIYYMEPISAFVQYELRLENGSMLHELLHRRFTSIKLYVYLCNITNAERFMSGLDLKIKIQEIGPFVYQEYRDIEDIDFKDPGIMRYTPKLETVFIREESIGDPKEINVTLPNISMLAGASLVSKYPFLVRQAFNMVTSINNLTAFVNLPAYDHIWGYSNPLIELANNVFPGLIYFKSGGILERGYDIDVDYRYEIGTRNREKFSVKKTTRIQKKNQKTDVKAFIDNINTFNNTYEGAAFPPGLTPDTPVHIYRHGLCKTFHLQHVATRRMQYGGDGFVYHFHNDTFNNKDLCDTTGWCPGGLKDVSSCYFGLPIAFSKSHFLDADPRLLDRIEGLQPIRDVHDTEIIVEPKIGVGISGSTAIQLNLFLEDISFNQETLRLKDTVLPFANIIAKSPAMIEEVESALRLTYSSGPYITGTSQLVCILLGLYLLSCSIKMVYRNRLAREQTNQKYLEQTQKPLLVC